MKNLKNIFVGFLVSFIGSVPLGYLNIVGFKIYTDQGILTTICYLLGVILIEFFVIYFTLIFANQLAANKKLSKYIEGFSVLFMFVLAYFFYANATQNETHSNEFSHFGYWRTFTSGIILSFLNFIQIPFWTSWNLYLLNGKYIEISNSRKYFYILGTVFGTFSGMLVLIFSLSYLTMEFEFLKLFLFRLIIPIVFVVLGIYQGSKFYIKYLK
jgi:threonine/homoserine/homoserine lactone efflux protein